MKIRPFLFTDATKAHRFPGKPLFGEDFCSIIVIYKN